MLISTELKKKLETEFVFSATRSGGPGGQNVNKVNTQVELRFSIDTSTNFLDKEKQLIRLKLKNRINLNLELGRHGTLKNTLIKEDYVRFSVNVNLQDIWFRKYKYE